MPLLDRPIRKKHWLAGVNGRHGVSANGHGTRILECVGNAGPWEAAVRQIASFENLGENWDGFGAEAPSPEVLKSAIGLADCYCEAGVDPPYRVAPGVAGSVILEWQEVDGTYATVEIDGPMHAEVMVVEPGKAAQQWTLPTE
jgi:hypothetical protein